MGHIFAILLQRTNNISNVEHSVVSDIFVENLIVIDVIGAEHTLKKIMWLALDYYSRALYECLVPNCSSWVLVSYRISLLVLLYRCDVLLVAVSPLILRFHCLFLSVSLLVY